MSFFCYVTISAKGRKVFGQVPGFGSGHQPAATDRLASKGPEKGDHPEDTPDQAYEKRQEHEAEREKRRFPAAFHGRRAGTSLHHLRHAGATAGGHFGAQSARRVLLSARLSTCGFSTLGFDA